MITIAVIAFAGAAIACLKSTAFVVHQKDGSEEI